MCGKSYFECFNHVPMYSDINGKAYLSPDCSLRLKDSRKEMETLEEFDSTSSTSTELVSLFNNGKYQICFANILSKEQCTDIIWGINEHLPLQDIEYDDVRKNKRYVVFDSNLAKYLWTRISKEFISFLRDENINLVPLGFSVNEGSWELCRINEAMRFNRYDSSSNDKFGIHRDAQFCPSADKRSIMSIVIYLNDDFTGGETKFHLPKNNNLNTKGMNIKDEVEAHGGLEKGFQNVIVNPKCGSAVLFSQSILHEGLPLTSGKKFILKTDIMVSRKPHLGFKLNPYESEDFFKCLDTFRTAQQHELDGNNKMANELYERCLSIRYSYPKALIDQVRPRRESSTDINPKKRISDDVSLNIEESNPRSVFSSKGINPFEIFPLEVWENIFNFLQSKTDRFTLIEVFPRLSNANFAKDTFEKMIPSLEYSKGVFSKFSFLCNSSFVKANIKAFCRVLCGYATYLLGQNKYNSYYIVNYNESVNEVTMLPFEQFLSSLFFKEKSFGTVYKVMENVKGNKNTKHDFEQGVERSYMLFKYHKEFLGTDLESHLKCDANIYSRQNKKANSGNEESFENVCCDQDNINMLIPKYMRLYDNVTHSRIQADSVSRDEVKKWNYLSYENDAIKEVNDSKLKYLECCNKAILLNSNIVGGGVVRFLKDYCSDIPFLKPKEHCTCTINSDKSVTAGVNYDFAKAPLNHLVFDFSKQEMCVSKIISNNDVIFSHLKERVQEELIVKHGLEVNLLKHNENFVNAFCVDISSMFESDISFNHASCQCGFPSASVREYVNLQSYSHIKNVYIIFKEVNPNKIFAWCCYGGIVAM